MRVLTRTIPITPIRLLALVSLLAVAITLLAVQQTTSRDASATHLLQVGLDFDTSTTGTSAGVYNIASLPAFENCIEVPTVGSSVTVDLFGLDVQQLIGFESYISFTESKLTVIGSQTNMFMASQPGSSVQNLSEGDPNPSTGVLTTVNSSGLYRAGAVDTGNLSGDTGSGVLSRLTFQTTSAGLAAVTIFTTGTGTTMPAVDPADPQDITYLGDTTGDGFYNGSYINKTGLVAIGAGYTCCPQGQMPPWAVPPNDPDCDGWTTAQENYMGTDPNSHCGINAWPPDFNNSNSVGITDVFALSTGGKYGTQHPHPNYSARHDLNADGRINILDVVKMQPPVFGSTCTP